MAHPEQMAWAENAIQWHQARGGRFNHVLEVGSLNVNGTVRDLFPRGRVQTYTGVDLGPGPCVDIVGHAADPQLPLPRKAYDVVISCEALEHDRRWRETVARMWDCLAPRGVLIVTCAGPLREEHGTHAHKPHNSPHTLDWYQGIALPTLLDAVIEAHGDDLRVNYLAAQTRCGQDTYLSVWRP